MKRFESEFPRLRSVEDLEQFKLDTFLHRCLDNPSDYDVFVVDNREDIQKSYIDYIAKHKFYGTYFFIDCTGIFEQYQQWFTIFPNIQPFYAVKCNPDHGIMKLVTTFPECCFDCASPGELDLALKNGVQSNHTIYANPIKSAEGIHYMQKNHVLTSTFDCVEELEKMYELLGDEFTKYNLVLRLYVDDSHSAVPLGSKFGAHKDEIPEILAKVKELNGRLIGVSFHVGSGCTDFMAYDNALKTVKEVFDLAKEYGYLLTLIDLGGGWSGLRPNEDNTELYSASTIVKNALHKYNLDGCDIISEPGRYFMNHTIDMCVFIDNILTNNNQTVYKINEGILGGFKDRLLCSCDYICVPLDSDKYPESMSSSNKIIIGPSGHAKDVIVPNASLPEMKIGDWLLFKQMGSYTMSIASKTMRDIQRHVYIIDKASLSEEAYQDYLKAQSL